MKWLFLLLLAANVAYYFLADPPPAPPEPVATDTAHLPTIPMLSETIDRPARPARPPQAAHSAISEPPLPPPAKDDRPYQPSEGELGSEIQVAADQPAAEPPQTETEASAPRTDWGANSGPATAPGRSQPPRQPLAAGTPAEPQEGAGGSAANVSEPANQAQPTAPGTAEGSTPPAAAAAAPPRTSEASEQPGTTATGDTVVPPPPSTQPPPIPRPTLACFRLGPFDDSASASADGQKAVRLGFQGRLLQTTSRVPAGFHIEVGPYDDPAEQQFAIEDLTQQGIGNVRIGDDEHTDKVMVGDFTSQEQAAKTLSRLEVAGFKARIVKRSRSVRHFYLDLEARVRPGSPPPGETLQTNFPRVDLQTRPCRDRP